MKVGNAEWAEDRVPVWYIMDEFGARVQHSADAPNVRMVPFISTIDGAAYSLLFPVKNVGEGEEITRYYLLQVCPLVCQNVTLNSVSVHPCTYLIYCNETND